MEHHHEHGKEAEDDHAHYDIKAARQLMNDKCIRFGSSRYAIKKLRLSSLDEVDKVRGMIDLAIELRFLRALFHPNIGACARRPSHELGGIGPRHVCVAYEN